MNHTILKKTSGLSTYTKLKKTIQDYLNTNPEKIDLCKFQSYTKVFKRETIQRLVNEIAGHECEFEFSQTTPLQKITPELENTPVQFNAMIISAGERQTYTKESDFKCSICKKIVHTTCDQFYRMIPPKCPDCKTSCDIIYNTRVLGYIQQIRLQEFLEVARNNTPVEYDAEILDNNVGEAYMGDRKIFVGKFRSIPDKPYNIIVFEIIEMYDMESKDRMLTNSTRTSEVENRPRHLQ